MIDHPAAESRRDLELAELRRHLLRVAEATENISARPFGFSERIQEIRREVESIRERLYELQFRL